MSKRIGWETDGFCVRCYFHGEVRPAQTIESDQPAERRRYCYQCEQYMTSKEEEIRQRRESRPPVQIGRYEKEAT